MNEKSMPCAYWRKGEICAKGSEPGYVDYCVLGPCSQMRPSKADKIRQKSDEELAEWIVHKTDGNGFDGYEESVKAWLGWLKQEVEE